MGDEIELEVLHASCSDCKEVRGLLRCDNCNKISTSRQGNTYTEKTVEVEKIYCCLCEYSTNRRVTMVEHMQTHTNTRPKKCELCGASFSSSYTLRRHIRSSAHSERPSLTCRICGKKFHTAHNLQAHQTTAHGTSKGYKCGTCSVLFQNRRYLLTHLLTHQK